MKRGEPTVDRQLASSNLIPLRERTKSAAELATDQWVSIPTFEWMVIFSPRRRIWMSTVPS